MAARPVSRTTEPRVMYAVMTPEPVSSKDLIPPPSPELLRHYGSSEVAIRRLRSRHHQVLLMRSPSIEDAAVTHRHLRIEALELAELHDGVVIDLAIPRVVEMRPDDVSLAHATQWYAVDYSQLSSGHLRTVGLSTFALPEVVVDGVDENGHAMYSAVLAGLTHRLIAEWPANDPVGLATVTLRDIAYGLGDPEAGATPEDRVIEVDVTYDEDAQLLHVALLADPATTLFAS